MIIEVGDAVSIGAEFVGQRPAGRLLDGLFAASRSQPVKRTLHGHGRRSWTVYFDAWCRAEGLDALPAAPMVVGAYLSAHATTLAPSTLTRRLSAIAVAHPFAGHQLDAKHPAIADMLAGIRRLRGVAPRQAAPATTDIVRAMVAQCDTATLIGIRDAALMLIGFAGTLRRSKFVGLDRQDVQIGNDGARVTLRRSKGDQVEAGELVGLARLPGSPTDVPEWRIARHTRHKSVVVRTYIRDGALMARAQSREVAL